MSGTTEEQGQHRRKHGKELTQFMWVGRQHGAGLAQSPKGDTYQEWTDTRKTDRSWTEGMIWVGAAGREIGELEPVLVRCRLQHQGQPRAGNPPLLSARTTASYYQLVPAVLYCLTLTS